MHRSSCRPGVHFAVRDRSPTMGDPALYHDHPIAMQPWRDRRDAGRRDRQIASVKVVDHDGDEQQRHDQEAPVRRGHVGGGNHGSSCKRHLGGLRDSSDGWRRRHRSIADHATLCRQAAASERTATTNALAFRRFRLPPVSSTSYNHICCSCCRKVKRTPDLAANMRANSPLRDRLPLPRRWCCPHSRLTQGPAAWLRRNRGLRGRTAELTATVVYADAAGGEELSTAA